jgi:hypothetical protein
MEVIRALQAKREKLWERREELGRGIARAVEGMKNEEERDRETSYAGEAARGTDVREKARWRIARLRRKMSVVDGRVGRLEDVIEMAVGDMEEGEGEGREGTGEKEGGSRGEVWVAVERARKRMERERRMLELVCEELKVEGV